MEFRIETQEYKTGARGRAYPKRALEFEDAQSMFDYIVEKCSYSVRTPELSPAAGAGGYLLFFDKTNTIEDREYWEKWKRELELIITDDEGNRVDIDSLSDLVGLEGVDSTGIIVRDGRLDPATEYTTVIYEAPIEG